MTDADIQKKIIETVKAGDLRQLKTLAGQFPDDLESFRNNKTSNTNLAEMAWNARKDDVAVYLIVQHGFEVSPQFDNHRNVLYSFAEGPNEYHRTMEVFANAAINATADHARDEAAGEMTEWAKKLNTERTRTLTLNPELMQQIANGNFAKFVHEKANDSRCAAILKSHSVQLAKALGENLPVIEKLYGASPAALISTGKTGRTV